MGANGVRRGPPVREFERRTLPAVFFGGVDRFAAAPALRWRDDTAPGGWRALFYAEAGDACARVAGWLAARGVSRGDRVAILSENRPEWALADYAALCIGAVTVPVYPTLPADQVTYILADAGACGVIVSTPDQAAKVAGWAEQAGAWVVLMDDTAAGTPTDVQRWNDVAAARPFEDLRASAEAARPDDLATLVYTSGTTGPPKGVMLSHGNFAYMVAATAQHGSVPAGPGDTCLSMLPLSHVFERAAGYYFWDAGVTIAYAESLAALPQNLADVRPHVMVAVPRLFDRLYERVVQGTGVKAGLGRWAAAVGTRHAEATGDRGTRTSLPQRLRFAVADRLVFATLRRRLGGRLRGFISGGAPLSRDVGAFFLAAGMPIQEGYGLTETSPVLAANRPGSRRLGTVGVPYPGVELRIAANGEIMARGPGIMHGYWRRPDDTAAVLEDDGWLHTGDVGEFDEDGFLRITDRLKDLIVTAGGKNIAPQPVEQEIMRSPYVAQAIMVGDRRAFPALLVVPDWAALEPWAREHGVELADRRAAVRHPALLQLMEEETAARVQAFARHEVPRRFSLLPDEFTVESGLLTPTLKAKRRAIEQALHDTIERLYQEVEHLRDGVRSLRQRGD
jgi:long-chain acyl-CoA synthetase